jgi:hypothetical protein
MKGAEKGAFAPAVIRTHWTIHSGKDTLKLMNRSQLALVHGPRSKQTTAALHGTGSYRFSQVISQHFTDLAALHRIVLLSFKMLLEHLNQHSVNFMPLEFGVGAIPFWRCDVRVLVLHLPERRAKGHVLHRSRLKVDSQIFRSVQVKREQSWTRQKEGAPVENMKQARSIEAVQHAKEGNTRQLKLLEYLYCSMNS